MNKRRLEEAVLRAGGQRRAARAAKRSTFYALFMGGKRENRRIIPVTT